MEQTYWGSNILTIIQKFPIFATFLGTYCREKFQNVKIIRKLLVIISNILQL